MSALPIKVDLSRFEATMSTLALSANCAVTLSTSSLSAFLFSNFCSIFSIDCLKFDSPLRAAMTSALMFAGAESNATFSTALSTALSTIASIPCNSIRFTSLPNAERVILKT